MSVSSDLISQFVKATKKEDKTKKETTVYGTARIRDNVTYVQIDGSELLTPVAEAAGAEDGERVTVLIKNHKAILNGNLDSPAARTGAVTDIDLYAKSLNIRLEGVENTPDVEIGGRNLYLGTRNFDGDKWVGMEHWETWEGDYLGFKEYGRYGAWQGLHQVVDVIEGETYTFSFYLKGNENAWVSVYTDWDDTSTTPAFIDIGTITQEHERYSVTFTANFTSVICPRIENHRDDGWIQICGLKFERGSQATDWSPAPEDAESGIDAAAKTATNFLSFDSDGLQIGDNTTGTWNGFRTQITSVAFNILNAAGTVLASYGEKLIELGKNATDAVIRLCGGKGTIEYDGDDMYLQMSSDSIRLKGTEMASLYSQYTDSSGTSRLGAVHAAPAEVQVVAGSGSNSSNLYIKPTQILMYSDDIRVDGTITDTNTGGTYASVVKGNSGIWAYRKYSNGDVELWGTYWVTDMACTNALGSMYRTHVFEPDSFPFAVYDANLTASYESDGYGAMLWATTTTTNYYPPNYYLIRPVSGTISYGQINFHVHGRWK